MSLNIGIQLFSVRDSLEKDARATIKKLREIGYDAIELRGGTEGLDPAELKALCDEIGLSIISAHVSAGSIINETEETLSLYKALGVSYIAIPALWGDYAYGGSEHAEMKIKLNAISPLFKENGIQILFHNHEWEFQKNNDKLILDEILGGFDEGNLYPEVDTGWATIGYGDASAYLSKYDGKCPIIHLKDFTYEGIHDYEKNGYQRPAGLKHRPVGYGRVDIENIINTAKAIGTKWFIVEEDESAFGLSELECASLSYNWLKTVVGR